MIIQMSKIFWQKIEIITLSFTFHTQQILALKMAFILLPRRHKFDENNLSYCHEKVPFNFKVFQVSNTFLPFIRVILKQTNKMTILCHLITKFSLKLNLADSIRSQGVIFLRW